MVAGVTLIVCSTVGTDVGGDTGDIVGIPVGCDVGSKCLLALTMVQNRENKKIKEAMTRKKMILECNQK